MASLVLQLQEAALDKSYKITDLLEQWRLPKQLSKDFQHYHSVAG